MTPILPYSMPYKGLAQLLCDIQLYIPYSRKIRCELYLAIWPPTAEIKYWRNLNLAICDCEAKFHYVILACGYGGS